MHNDVYCVGGGGAAHVAQARYFLRFSLCNEPRNASVSLSHLLTSGFCLVYSLLTSDALAVDYSTLTYVKADWTSQARQLALVSVRRMCRSQIPINATLTHSAPPRS